MYIFYMSTYFPVCRRIGDISVHFEHSTILSNKDYRTPHGGISDNLL